MVKIRGRDPMFIRGEVIKSDKGYLRRMKIKSIMRIYLREVIYIGSKTMFQILQCDYNGETVKRQSGEMVKYKNCEMVQW